MQPVFIAPPLRCGYCPLNPERARKPNTLHFMTPTSATGAPPCLNFTAARDACRGLVHRRGDAWAKWEGAGARHLALALGFCFGFFDAPSAFRPLSNIECDGSGHGRRRRRGGEIASQACMHTDECRRKCGGGNLLSALSLAFNCSWF